MDTSNISQLEGSVTKLLKMYQALQQENTRLQKECGMLIEKNTLASNKIENMISKLKEQG